MLSNNLPNYSSNGAYDDAGKPLFYIIDNKFYDANGTDISLTAYFKPPFGLNNTNLDYMNYGSEVIIFKDETQCKPTYDIIYSVARMNDANLPIRCALLHAKIFYDGFDWKPFQNEDELLYVLPNYTKSSTFTMALSSKDSQGRRFLFAKAGGELNVWKYENGNFGTNQTTEFGFTHTSAFIPHIYLTGNVQYWEDEIRTELECTPLPNDKFRIALSFTDRLASPVNVKLGILDFDMTNYSFTSKYIKLPCNSTNYAYPKGIEFSPNGQYLYTTICYPAGVTPANIFNYIDCNQASPNLTAISSSKIPNQTNYQYSALELAFDKCLYFTKKNSSNVGIGLSRLQNLDTPGALIFNDNIVTGLNQNLSKGIGQTAFPNEPRYWLFNLPDQIDGENYSSNYGNGSASIYDTINTSTTFSGTNTIVRIIGDVTLTGGATLSFLNGVKVYINPDVKITVTNGSKIRVLTGSKLQAACEYMWEGIIADGVNATVDLYGTNNGIGATIQDAKAAITSNNGARVNIYGSAILNKNYRNIVINNYASNHTFNIKNARIGTFNPANNVATSDLIKPYFGVRSYSGIEINGNTLVNIGAFASSADLVTFNNLDLGIENINSNTNIYNCMFRNIEGNKKVKNTNPDLNIPTNAVMSSEPSIGVYSRTENTTNNYSINVGEIGTNQYNQFLNNNWGVLISGNYNSRIYKNTFENLNQGIKVQQTNTSGANGVLINSNMLDNVGNSIFIQNCNYSTGVGINNNSINTIATNPQNWGYGVLVVGTHGSSLPAGGTGLGIQGNIVKKVKNGIFVNTFYSPDIISNDVYDVTEDLSTMNNGIYVTNSNNADIRDNLIYGYSTSWTTSGIRVEQCANDNIRCNATYRVGRGIFISGSHPSLTLTGNRMNNNLDGLFLYGGSFNPQRDDLASQNIWQSFSATGFSHTMSYNSTGGESAKLFVKNVSTYKPIVNKFYGGVDSMEIVIRTDTFNVGCPPQTARLNANSSLSNGDEEITDMELFIANGGELNYPINSATTNWYARYNLFNKLKNNPSLAQGNNVLTDFINKPENENLRKLDNSLYSELLALRLSENIQSPNNCEKNLEDVRKIQKGILKNKDLNRRETMQLRNIASKCPYEDGPAVYEARAILAGIEPEIDYTNICEIIPADVSEFRLAGNLADAISNVGYTRFYPNTANNTLNVSLKGIEDEDSLTIKNQLGQVVENKVCTRGNATLNVENLAAGVYLIEFNANGVKEQHKLVKQ